MESSDKSYYALLLSELWSHDTTGYNDELSSTEYQASDNDTPLSTSKVSNTTCQGNQIFDDLYITFVLADYNLVVRQSLWQP